MSCTNCEENKKKIEKLHSETFLQNERVAKVINLILDHLNLEYEEGPRLVPKKLKK